MVRHWDVCPMCSMMVFIPERHKCPQEVRAIAEKELDAIIECETENWSTQINEFWDNKTTRFHQWLVENKRI